MCGEMCDAVRPDTAIMNINMMIVFIIVKIMPSQGDDML